MLNVYLLYLCSTHTSIQAKIVKHNIEQHQCEWIRIIYNKMYTNSLKFNWNVVFLEGDQICDTEEKMIHHSTFPIIYRCEKRNVNRLFVYLHIQFVISYFSDVGDLVFSSEK